MSQPDDFVKEFLVESREGLDRLDGDLIALEENPRSQDRCDSAFRSLHTIKGNAGFLDFHRLGALAHAGESVLQLLRGGEIQLTARVTDALLELLDALRRMLACIEQTGSEGDDYFEEVEAKLKHFAGPDAASQVRSKSDSDPFTPTMTFTPNEGDSRAEAPAHQHAEDFDMATIARPLSSNPPDEKAARAASSKAADARLSKSASAAKETKKTAGRTEPGDSSILGTTADLDSSRSLAGVLDAESDHGSSHSGSPASSLIRVDVHLLDRLMNLVGELVLARNQIVETFGHQTSNSTTNAVQRLNLLTSELQEGVLKSRMQRIGTLWHRYPRMVRDLARNCHKQVSLDVQGDDTELDKTLLEALTDPLLHLIRNSIDHGIEAPEDRRAADKSEQGRLSLRAWHQGGHVHIEVSDDGAGLSTSRIRGKAIQRGLITAEQADQMEDRDLYPLLFSAGFSTSEVITSLSGRGVGLDVVKTNIEDIGGTVDIESTAGQGTTVHITVPLTLAIVPALIVRQNGQRYAIPQVNVIELINLEGPEATQPGERFHNAPVYRLRGEMLPLLWLSEVFGREIQSVPTDSEDGLNIVVLQAGARRFALVVDAVNGTEEIVVKPIGSILDDLTFYTGATIMGDGTVALILDILGLARHAGLLVRMQAFAESNFTPGVRASDNRSNLLVCRVGRRQIGVPLTDVSRLTSVIRDGIDLVGQREVAQDGEGMLSLMRAHELFGEPVQAEPDRLPVIVHQGDHGPVGLIVEHILDIVEQPIDTMENSPGDRTRAVVIRGKVTDLIDLHSLIGDAGLESTGAAGPVPAR